LSLRHAKEGGRDMLDAAREGLERGTLVEQCRFLSLVI
jgi:hypothetical protein